MKRLFLILVLLAVAVSASGQYVQGPLKRVGGTLKSPSGKLTKEELAQVLQDIDGQDCTAEWKKAKGWRGAGVGLIAGGSVMGVGGLGLFMVGALTSAVGGAVGATAGAVAGSIGGKESSQSAAQQGAQQGVSAGKGLMTAGVIVTGVGVACTLAGIPLVIVNCTRMSHLADRYNASHGEEGTLEVSLVPGGVGLTYSF